MLKNIVRTFATYLLLQFCLYGRLFVKFFFLLQIGTHNATDGKLYKTITICLKYSRILLVYHAVLKLSKKKMKKIVVRITLTLYAQRFRRALICLWLPFIKIRIRNPLKNEVDPQHPQRRNNNYFIINRNVENLFSNNIN